MTCNRRTHRSHTYSKVDEGGADLPKWQLVTNLLRVAKFCTVLGAP
jgi:hypothetical protein